MTKVAILSSHNGSGFDTLYQASQKKELDIEIVLLVSNNSTSPALQNAKQRNIKNQLVNTKTDSNPDSKIYELLKESQATHIFLSGYMKKVSQKITTDFTVINSHPSLLPKFGGKGMYGRLVHEAVIKEKEKMSGVTVHEVNEVYDDGRIILQKEITILPEDTVESLESKVKMLEKTAIVEAFEQCLK